MRVPSFYTRLRKDRKYLPTWNKLTAKQQDAVRKFANKAFDAECGLAGDIMRDTHERQGKHIPFSKYIDQLACEIRPTLRAEESLANLD